jgi:hypothetical protein
MSAEVLVLPIAAFLYLTDLGRLLFVNEILLVAGTYSKWTAITPADGFFFRRRFAVFPRPYDPRTAVIRLSWPITSPNSPVPTKDIGQDIYTRLEALSVPRVVCALLLPEIFLGIPFAYALPNNDWPVLGMIVVIYIQILLLVVWLFSSRNELKMTGKDSVILAFESLVCLPYAINFYRKVAEKTICSSGMDVLDTGECLLEADGLKTLRDHIRNALDDRLEGEQGTAKISEGLARLQHRLNQGK